MGGKRRKGNGKWKKRERGGKGGDGRELGRFRHGFGGTDAPEAA